MLLLFLRLLSSLVLMADEVYQENIYQDKTPFTSCKKVSSAGKRPIRVRVTHAVSLTLPPRTEKKCRTLIPCSVSAKENGGSSYGLALYVIAIRAGGYCNRCRQLCALVVFVLRRPLLSSPGCAIEGPTRTTSYRSVPKCKCRLDYV